MAFSETLATPQLTAAGETRRPDHIYDLLVRDDPRLDLILQDEARGLETIQQLLAVSVLGFLFYGFAVGLAQQLLGAGLGSRWIGTMPILTLPFSLTIAFLLALLVCLPSFYFYTQLSGLDASFRLITAQALRVQARTAVLLLGALPFYIAVVLAALAGAFDGTGDILLLGMALPFVVGLAGLRSLHRSFARLAAELPVAHARRPGFLSRMVFAWGMVYSVVCPIALWRVGEMMTALLGR